MERALTQTEASIEAKVSGLPALDIPELYQCVHCGLCLDQCPTYRALHIESESPRGRIHLGRPAATAPNQLNKSLGTHLNLCLMCRACESACPSGVQYGRIAEAAREILGPPGPPATRMLVRFALRHVMPYPRRLRVVAWAMRLFQGTGLAGLVARILPDRLRRRLALMPEASGGVYAPEAEGLPAIGGRGARGAFL